MENRNNDDYQSAKENARIFYAKIEKVWCPALNDFIVFNRAGFQHLLRKRGRRRTEAEQKRRFSLLPFTGEIIGDPDIKISHEKTNRFLPSDNAEFWKLFDRKNGNAVTVVIRQLHGGKKHFFSVY